MKAVLKHLTTIIAVLALVFTMLQGFALLSVGDKLDRIDERLDGITSELTQLKDPTYQQQQFNEKLSRVLDEVRRRQEIALAHSE